MTQSISIRREGNLIVIEDREDTKDHAGVLKATYLNVAGAFGIGQALIEMARHINNENLAKQISLATARDPYPEDAR